MPKIRHTFFVSFFYSGKSIRNFFANTLKNHADVFRKTSGRTIRFIRMIFPKNADLKPASSKALKTSIKTESFQGQKENGLHVYHFQNTKIRKNKKNPILMIALISRFHQMGFFSLFEFTNCLQKASQRLFSVSELEQGHCHDAVIVHTVCVYHLSFFIVAAIPGIAIRIFQTELPVRQVIGNLRSSRSQLIQV